MRDVDVAALESFSALAYKYCQQQRAMSSVHVGVVMTMMRVRSFYYIEVVSADTRAQRRDQGTTSAESICDRATFRREGYCLQGTDRLRRRSRPCFAEQLRTSPSNRT